MIVLPVLAMAAAQAEPPPNPEWNCADPVAQPEINWCVHQDYLAADEQLNVQWEATADKMRQRDMAHDNSHDSRPGYFAQLLEGQRAWLKYRDAHCASEGYVARGGSMEPMLVSICLTNLTGERTQQLRDIEVWPE